MLRKALLMTALVSLLATTPGALAATTYDVDAAHTTVLFSIRHLLTQVQGKFTDFEGLIVYDPAAPQAASVEFTVQAASVDTNNDKRDEHLRSEDFFHVSKHSTLSFKSVAVEPKGKDMLEVTGAFSLHGVTKTITVPVKVLGVLDTKEFGKKAGFSTTFTISRKDYNMTWNRILDAGAIVLGDEVTVDINVEANGRAEPAPATE